MADLTEIIAENFGANASYVEGLLNRFRGNPTSVDEAWRTYFAELLNGGNGDPTAATSSAGNGRATTTTTAAGRGNGDQAAGKQNGPSQQNAASTTAAAAAPAPDSKSNASTSAAKAELAAPSAAAAANAQPIRGGALKIVENMEASLAVPTATSQRQVPVKVLEENRIIINRHLQTTNRGKASFTHLIAWALVRALRDKFPQMNDGYVEANGAPARARRQEINLGLAIDMEKKDGTRTLLVPNIKNAGAMNFAEFLHAYNDVVKKARENKLQVADFQGTTISLTNPGTLGTIASMPRLMAGQSVIVATGAIEFPAEYHAMAPEALSQLGISRSFMISSTYDHRIIQGAESGAFLAYAHELLLGEHRFYDDVFADLGVTYLPLRWSVDRNPALLGGDHVREQTVKQARVVQMINAYRVRGHLIADTDPLNAVPVHYHAELAMETYGLTIWDLDREFITAGLAGTESATLRQVLEILQRSYCGSVGVEFRHISSPEEKTWLQERLESKPEPVAPEIRKQILWKLISAEQFERFLHTKYLGQKRFSVEGSETVIPVLDQLVEGAGARGIEDVVLGMAHRGRLNVLANVMGSFSERIFTAFEGSVHPSFPADEGDVKYHQGARGQRLTASGNTVRLTLSPNPSHLEFVDPVVEGMVRAQQDAMSIPREETLNRAMPVLLHGDAAFSGQGVVMETLNFVDLRGYRTGGTIHLIINNQIGFTTSPEAGRSTIYSTDVAKMTQCPIFHVNGDDPDAAYRVLELALDFRQQFHKDVVIDVIGFRRLGHNEGDEPSYTQPLMYARVKAHEGVRVKYARQLVKEKALSEQDVEQLIEQCVSQFEQALAGAKEIVANKPAKATELKPPAAEEDGSAVIETGVKAGVISDLAHKIAVVPEGFHINPKMVGQLARRARMGTNEVPMDWAFAELMAFGSLVLEGTRVRLSGQDSGRGTFSQRHAIMYDTQTGQSWTPLSELSVEGDPTARFSVYDSSLSEAGVLGFEYGYSVIAEKALVMWEAQFGDFGNGAQVIVDQFISPSEDKWQQRSRLVMLLPHGYEGQGPEHSSARLERYLQLCAENNLQVCNPTTPAQYFHLLRRQVKQTAARPLVVMTPKSLLRLPAAVSAVDDLTKGGFRPVIDDAQLTNPERVERVAICSGKVYYDLEEARRKEGNDRVAIVRLEQFYPFPEEALRATLARYPNSRQLIWVQEEPQNMGAWWFLADRLEKLLPKGGKPRYVGRAASASPATGSYAIHQLEQTKLVQEALLLEDQPEVVATDKVPKMGTDG